MRLPTPSRHLTVAEQIAEFDLWITPTLGEVRDTVRFQNELQRVEDVFDALASATGDFSSIDVCTPSAVTDALTAMVVGLPRERTFETLHGAACLLYLSTGKSDNNVKCQLPLHLRDTAKWLSYPTFRRKNGVEMLASKAIPRVLKADRYMDLVAALAGHPDQQRRLLHEFVRFLLSDRTYIEQLWSIGRAFVTLRAQGKGRQFLTPLVIFQVRGSVSAAGGHEPERRLRLRFDEWGLVRGVDYNVHDVKVLPGGTMIETLETTEAPADEPATEAKTRAYDFILPYRTPGWRQTVFVQGQFYAGDSGSVSHKNLDQVKGSRPVALAANSNAIFIEYVDGAGYFASLTGDLRKLLSMEHTSGFIQVRSAPVRLRRVLQEAGFLTPLEIEHAIARTDGSTGKVAALLVSEGYAPAEVKRAMGVAISGGQIDRAGKRLAIRGDRREIARRYFILDTIALNGSPLTTTGEPPTGYLQVPGFGAFFGAKLKDVVAAAVRGSSAFATDINATTTFAADLDWLASNRFVISS